MYLKSSQYIIYVSRLCGFYKMLRNNNRCCDCVCCTRCRLLIIDVVTVCLVQEVEQAMWWVRSPGRRGGGPLGGGGKDALPLLQAQPRPGIRTGERHSLTDMSLIPLSYAWTCLLCVFTKDYFFVWSCIVYVIRVFPRSAPRGISAQNLILTHRHPDFRAFGRTRCA